MAKVSQGSIRWNGPPAPYLPVCKKAEISEATLRALASSPAFGRVCEARVQPHNQIANSSSQQALSDSSRAVPFTSEALVAVATGACLTMLLPSPVLAPVLALEATQPRNLFQEPQPAHSGLRCVELPFISFFCPLKCMRKGSRAQIQNEEENRFYGLPEDLSALSQRKLHSSHQKSVSHVKTPKTAIHKWVDPHKVQKEAMKGGGRIK